MPGKSRHSRGKHLPQSKKKKSRSSRPTRLTQQPAFAQTPEPVSRPDVPAPSASVPTSVAKPVTVRYPHITAELRMIGILAGIMLIILIVLTLVLP